MMIFLLPSCLLTCFIISLLPTAAGSATKKKNIVFVVIDDLGWDDVGFRSQEILTPNIDGLAAAGVVLDQCYVQDVCSPSRATFMTGRFAMHHSVVDWIPPASAYGLPLNETTLGTELLRIAYSSTYRSLQPRK